MKILYVHTICICLLFSSVMCVKLHSHSTIELSVKCECSSGRCRQRYFKQMYFSFSYVFVFFKFVFAYSVCWYAVLKNKKPTRWHLLFYCTSCRLNMFRALLCPSSEARDYDVDYHIGRLVLDLLYSGGKVLLVWSSVRSADMETNYRQVLSPKYCVFWVVISKY